MQIERNDMMIKFAHNKNDKKRYFMIGILIFFSLLSVCVFIFNNNLEWNWENHMPKEYKDSRHNWSDSYNATFDMMLAENEYIGIGIKNNIYSKKIQKEITEILVDKFELMKKQTLYRPDKKIYIYILDKTIQNQIFLVDSSIYCSIDHINSEDFLYYLVSLYFDIKEPWKAIGLCGYINESLIDNSKLADYYLNADNFDLLGLFGGRFLHEWNTKEEFEIAFMTAYSYTKYLINDNDILDFLYDDMDNRQEWLTSIGVNKELDESSEIMDITCYAKDNEYPLIVHTNDSSYYFKPIENYFTTAEQMEEFIRLAKDFREYLQNYLRKNAAISFSKLNVDVSYRYYMRTGLSLCYVDRKSNEINLAFGIYGLTHEIVHEMIPYKRDERWIDEGLAEYLSCVVYPNNEKRKWYYDTICQFDKNDDIYKFYIEHGGSLNSISDFNMELAIDAYCYAKLRNQSSSWEQEHFNSPLISDLYHIDNKNKSRGDELTYFQASSFVNYLVKKYTIDTVIDFCNSTISYEDYFGYSYIQLKQDWIAEIGK